MAVAILLAIVGVSCGPPVASRNADSAQPAETAPGPFRVVASEKVYLNGSENKGRLPITFLLVASAVGERRASDAELMEEYATALGGQGWRISPYRAARDWWQYYGERDSQVVRLGPASRFTAMATVDEGFAVSKFRDVSAGITEPLIAVSIDPLA